MTSILREVWIVLRFCWIWTEVSAKGELFERNITLTWIESLKYCQDIGKVLFDVKDSMSETILRNILNDTDQTWVSATVEFSHFVNVPVCMGTNNQLIANKTFDTDIIGNCLKFCNGYLYAGLKDRDCFCFKDVGNLTQSKRCNSTCNNDPVHQCGGNESISVYQKADKGSIRYIEYGYKECVYAKKTGQFTNLFTGSCVGQVANGAICDGVNYLECRKQNWTPVEKSLCRMDLAPPLKWMQTNHHCTDIGGQLGNAKLYENKLIENWTYSSGSYRIPMIHKAEVLQRINNDTICAVARRAGNLVLIEGEDCFTKHAILCQDDSLERLSSSTSSSTQSTEIIYGTVASVLIIALVISALVCLFRRRRQIFHQHVDVSKTDSSGEQHALLKMQISNPPVKPSRKARTKKENLLSSYENVSFARRGQDEAVQQPGHSNFVEEAYDKIYLDKEHMQENGFEEGGNNVYDHGTLHIDEDQYDRTVMPFAMTPILDETYDRTTLRQTINIAISVHREEGIDDPETGKQIDKEYDTIEGQT
ncbi:hypothetical protein CHS0354_030997 [Potamilus streckersoni]|uniref:WSC domain-containing protein n=1 Tax=Potamilus streckersoni TaxID=2493646 RepID=A0AAE0VPE9_9BIVA|nr:hypothetical protein CHS0354_030997 [Potamilus streckersoni]